LTVTECAHPCRSFGVHRLVCGNFVVPAVVAVLNVLVREILELMLIWSITW